MKKVNRLIIFIGVFAAIIYACTRKLAPPCSYYYTNSDIVQYTGKASKNNACLQKIKFLLNPNEYGFWLNEINNSCTYFDGNSFNYTYDTLFKDKEPVLKAFFSLKENTSFFISKKDTVYKIIIDAKFQNISNAGMDACLFFNKDKGFVGAYVNDHSPYIQENYKKNIVRSIIGITDTAALDTAKTIISYLKFKR